MIGKNFYYTKTIWNHDRTVVSFQFTLDTNEKSFELIETLELPVPAPRSVEIDKIIRALHLALGISYYKSFIPPKIYHPYAMDDNEADFWNTTLKNGLGEFLYINSLKPTQLATFKAQEGTIFQGDALVNWSNEALLGLGGGKDSIVAGELLKSIGIKPTSFVLATGEILGQTKSVADTMGIKLLPIKRRLDLQILELNGLEGAYNGHVPISLIFALSGCLLAAIKSAKYVVVANEASASIPQINFEGLKINHQWSKSLEFERLFQKYIYENISKNLTYFSAIRPLTSLGVAKLFSSYPLYYTVFTSDNSVFRIHQDIREHPRWSTDSPKSLSSFILLAPWMSEDELELTFGSNFLDKDELGELFVSLLGRNNLPILDCVGTPNELLYSLQQLYSEDRLLDTKLMQIAINTGLIGNKKSRVNSEFVTNEESFPKVISQKLNNQIQKGLTA